MKIAKIVSSNSHLDYVARILDTLDTEKPPSSTDFGFGQFVSIQVETDEIIGIIYNSMLINPEYSSFGPRLSPVMENSIFSPDYLNEQGLLVGIILLGTIADKTVCSHGVPRRLIPPGQDVSKAKRESIDRFHASENGGVKIHYFSQLVSNTGSMAVPLMESIIDELSNNCTPEDIKRLNVLKRSLIWQRALGSMRL